MCRSSVFTPTEPGQGTRAEGPLSHTPAALGWKPPGFYLPTAGWESTQIPGSKPLIFLRRMRAWNVFVGAEKPKKRNRVRHKEKQCNFSGFISQIPLHQGVLGREAVGKQLYIFTILILKPASSRHTICSSSLPQQLRSYNICILCAVWDILLPDG